MLLQLCILALDSSPFFNFRTDPKLYEEGEEGTNQLELRTWKKIRVTELLKKEITKAAREDREQDVGENSIFAAVYDFAEEWRMNVHQCRGYIETPESNEYCYGKYAIAQGIDDHSVTILESFVDNNKMYYYPVELICNVFEEFVKKVDIVLN